jgi:hypothetical protein
MLLIFKNKLNVASSLKITLDGKFFLFSVVKSSRKHVADVFVFCSYMLKQLVSVRFKSHIFTQSSVHC